MSTPKVSSRAVKPTPKSDEPAKSAGAKKDEPRRGPTMRSGDGVFNIIWPDSRSSTSDAVRRWRDRLSSRRDDDKDDKQSEGGGLRRTERRDGFRTRITFSSFGGGSSWSSSTAIEALAKDAPVAATKKAEKAGVVPPKNAKLFGGAQVSITEGKKEKHAGALVGFDSNGKPLVRTSAGKIVKPDGDYTLNVKAGQDFVSALQGIPSKNVHQVPKAQREAFAALLKLKAGDKKSKVDDYIKAIHGAGGEVFITGGAVRDALSGKTPRDVDLTTTMWCEDVRDVLKAKKIEEGRANTTYGTVLISGWDKVEPVDICSFKRPGGTFGFDLKDDIRFRDFSINALYYDPMSGLIADPTGSGVSDVKNKILRPTCRPGEEKQWIKDNSSAPLRLLKFTLRGYTPAKGLIELIKKNLDACLDDMDSFRKSAAMRSIGEDDDVIKKEMARLGFTKKEIEKVVGSRSSFFSIGGSSRSRSDRGDDSSSSRASDDGMGSWFF